MERPLGFISKNFIEPGKEEDVESVVQLPFTGSRLIVPEEVAEYFDILDIRVGWNSLFINSEPVPAVAYSPLSWVKGEQGPALRFPEAQVGQAVMIRARNKHQQFAIKFLACLIGEVPQ